MLSTVLHPNTANTLGTIFRIAEVLDIDIKCVNRFRDTIKVVAKSAKNKLMPG